MRSTVGWRLASKTCRRAGPETCAGPRRRPTTTALVISPLLWSASVILYIIIIILSDVDDELRCRTLLQGCILAPYVLHQLHMMPATPAMVLFWLATYPLLHRRLSKSQQSGDGKRHRVQGRAILPAEPWFLNLLRRFDHLRGNK